MSWDLRRLCNNGACIGVLANDGTCPQCGQVGEGTIDTAEQNSDDASHDEAHPVAEAVMDTAEPWDDRQLCDNGACIGVMQTGICTTCGLATQASDESINGQMSS
jgi:hypothetical protein